MQKRDIVVVGCSSGGLEALKTLVCALSTELPASVLIVQHILPDARPLLPEILNNLGRLPAKLAEEGEEIQHRQIYVAPPDHHLLLTDGKLKLTKTARENRTRPAADALFRTAAQSHGSRVIGVILTGNLDDGAAGLKVIKDQGGTVVVQDPKDAAYPSMPETALLFTEADHLEPIHRIGEVLNRIAGTEAPDGPAVSTEDGQESIMNARGGGGAETMEEIGTLVPVTCPDCGGPLWEIEDQPVPRYRCHTGHAFGRESLVAGFSEVTERSLWTALRVMDEKTRVLEGLSQNHRKRGHDNLAKRYDERANESGEQADQIRHLLQNFR